MDITTTRVQPHEIAKNEDFEFAFQSIIRNSAVLDRMLTSTAIDYVVGGVVRAAEGMTLKVDALWANGRNVDLPAYSDTISGPIAVTAPVNYPRYDIIQVRGIFEGFDTQRRAFWEPELQVAQYQNIHVKHRLIVEILVKQGDEGSIYAPEVDPGYVKIAEIYTEPGDVALTQDNIINVSAMYQGEENTGWTSERTRTFYLGSISDMRAAFDLEHYIDGQHRKEVIRAHNILLGVAEDALKGSVISVGENLNSGDLSLLAPHTILEALVAIGQILHGDKENTLLKNLSMLLSWKSEETYQPFMPTFFQSRIFCANPINLPEVGQSPDTHPGKWISALALEGLENLPEQLEEIEAGLNNKAESKMVGDPDEIAKFNSNTNAAPKSGLYPIVSGTGIGLDSEFNLLLHIRHPGYFGHAQLAFPATGNKPQCRVIANNGPSPWRELAFTDSPVFSGTPKVPSKTSAATNDSTLIATEYQVVLKANLASPTFTGTPQVPSKSTAAGNNPTYIATEAQVALKANTASPNLTGNPTAPVINTIPRTRNPLINITGTTDSPATLAEWGNQIVSMNTLRNALVQQLFPVGTFYTQYPMENTNSSSEMFPSNESPTELFGGTWTLMYDNDNVYFKTGVAGDHRGALWSASNHTWYEGYGIPGVQSDAMREVTGYFDGQGAVAGGNPDNYLFTTRSRGAHASGNSSNTNYANGYNFTLSNKVPTDDVIHPRNRLIKVWKRTA